jgi:hypothetical protein
MIHGARGSTPDTNGGASSSPPSNSRHHRPTQAEGQRRLACHFAEHVSEAPAIYASLLYSLSFAG